MKQVDERDIKWSFRAKPLKEKRGTDDRFLYLFKNSVVEELLKFLVAVIYAELLEAVCLKIF